MGNSLKISATSLSGFFFSSGRRHTISLRDWSSDVCSSDLWVVSQGGEIPLRYRLTTHGGACDDAARSEERRVGKECRSRWPADRQKERRDQRGRARSDAVVVVRKPPASNG